MTDPKTTPKKTEPKEALPVGAIQDPERALRDRSNIEAAVQNIVRAEREAQQAEMLKVLNDLRIPIRDDLPELTPSGYNRRGEPVHRLSSPTDPMYRRMSEAEREWRNPDSDHYMAEWIRGQVRQDHGRMLLAEEKLRGMFGRATSTDGVAGAEGAESTGTAGALVPRPLEAVVMIARDRIAKMRRFATIIQMTRQNHQIPTAAAMTAAMVGESTSPAQGEPTMASVDLIAKTGAVQARATKEILADAAVNLINIFAVRGGGALGVLEDNQAFRLGAGTGDNITKISGTTFTETTSGGFAYTLDALRMYYSVAQEYRDQAVWFAASNVLQLLSGVRDTTGRPLYLGLTDVPGPISDDRGAIGAIFRRPVYEVPFSNGELWFGDPAAQYAFGSRQGIMVEVSDHVRFLEREVVWLLTERFAGANLDSSASAYCTGITSATSL